MIEKLRDIYEENILLYKDGESDYGYMRKPNIDEIIEVINDKCL